MKKKTAIIPQKTSKTEITDSDKSNLENVMKPIKKVYYALAIIASVIAAVYLVIAGISLFTSSNNPLKKEQSKQTIGYVILGLIVIWVAPFIINYLTVT